MTDHSSQLAQLLREYAETLLAQWRAQVRKIPSARGMDTPALNDHIPSLLDELIAALEANSDDTILEIDEAGSAPFHGLQRLQDAFDVEEVVAEYNLLRTCIHELAEQHALLIYGKDVRILHRVLDHAIGSALATYTRQQNLELQRRRHDYLAFVAHDLRTPLNAISLAARLLESAFPGGGDNPNTHLLKTLRRNVGHLETLVGRVLEENAHLQNETGLRLELRDIDLWPLVEDLVHELRPVAAAAGTVLVNRVPEDLSAHADASQLQRVLQNLIGNAIKYTPLGEVAIAAERCDDGGIACWVSDNGAGIPVALKEKVFERGESDPDRDDATGLGLAIVRMITEAHGGMVTVQSQEGYGSTFRFTLPGRGEVAADVVSAP
jgi:two-component system phosphate regulon sensor histidine kinase PhoR